MSAIQTIPTDALAAVNGGHPSAEAALDHVGGKWRCAYVTEHLGKLGADAAFMSREPRISPTDHFTDSDLKDRLQMEYFYKCRTGGASTSTEHSHP
jgi:hypothetical protein